MPCPTPTTTTTTTTTTATTTGTTTTIQTGDLTPRKNDMTIIHDNHT
jgi:hypothetical protein